jgi:prepilin-type processing-associated H-X9-DG protein
MHFRHQGSVNVAWCDGHVGSGGPMFTRIITSGFTPNTVDVDYAAFGLGWFGPDDNSLFSLDKKNTKCAQIPAP